MSNIISPEQEIHPITAKLLSGELKLSEITLEQFREGRTIYNSYKEAKCKGYEAHHIVPRSCQEELEDDRCLRLTAFEHIIDHYLMAKENSNYLKVFYGMMSFNKDIINDKEKSIISKCIEFSSLREIGRQKVIESNSGENAYWYGKHRDTETREKISKSLQGSTGFWKGKTFSEEMKQKLSESRKGKRPSQATIQKARESNMGRAVSLETRQKISKALTGLKRNEDFKQKVRERMTGDKNPNYGKKRDPKTIEKMVLQKKRMAIMWKEYKETEDYQKNPITWNDFIKLNK